MDFVIGDEENPHSNKYVEWIVVPVLAVLTAVTFGFSVNGVVNVIKWNEQFKIPRYLNSPCDLLRQGWRKFEVHFKVPSKLDWVNCFSLGICTLATISTVITIRVMQYNASKRYAGNCGLNCLILILLTAAVAAMAYFNHFQRYRHLEEELYELAKVHKTTQLNVLQAYIVECLDKKADNLTALSFTNDEDSFVREDDAHNGTLVKYSDCYQHCPVSNSDLLFKLSIALASLCFVCGCPILYFIVQQWKYRRTVHEPRYAHLQELSERENKPTYVLQQNYIATPDDYGYQHDSFYYNSSPAY